MKKFLSMLIISMLCMTAFSASAFAAKGEIEPMEFARTYTVSNVTGTAKTIVEDQNTKHDTDISCTWKSSAGPTTITVYCYIYYNGSWSFYDSKSLSLNGTFSTHISGGEPFRLTVKRTAGNDGTCIFGVTLI